MAVALVNKFLDALGLANDNDEQEVENEDIYEFDEEKLHDGSLSFQSFDSYTREWADFIFANRNNHSRENIHSFDIVYGPIANDKVGVQIRNVLENNIDMDTFLECLHYMKGITFQYFFATQKAINSLRLI